ARLAVADDLLANARPHAIAADQRAAAHLLARFEADRDRVAVILEVVDAAARLERDEVVALAGLEIDALNVGTVRHRIGLLEARLHLLAERDGGDELARQRVAHLEIVRDPGVLEHGVIEADALECSEDVGAELDAGAELLEFLGLLEHPHREALERERVGGDQPADAAARDQKRQIAVGTCHLALLTSQACGAAPRPCSMQYFSRPHASIFRCGSVRRAVSYGSRSRGATWIGPG